MNSNLQQIRTWHQKHTWNLNWRPINANWATSHCLGWAVRHRLLAEDRSGLDEFSFGSDNYLRSSEEAQCMSFTIQSIATTGFSFKHGLARASECEFSSVTNRNVLRTSQPSMRVGFARRAAISALPGIVRKHHLRATPCRSSSIAMLWSMTCVNSKRKKARLTTKNFREGYSQSCALHINSRPSTVQYCEIWYRVTLLLQRSIRTHK